MSNQVRYEKLQHTVDLISVKLTELIKLSSIEDLDAQNAATVNEESEISAATTSMVLVTNQTVQLIKGVQDLLMLTRDIREKWLLYQIPGKNTANPQPVDNVELKKLLKRSIKEIVGDTEL